MSAGYVYVLKNRSYPHLKIGCTTKTPEERAAELSGTGLPHPFKVVYSVQVADCRAMERQVHEHFADQRVSPNREFFALTVADAITGIDRVIKTTAYKPEVEPEKDEEMLRIAHHPNSPPPHNTHVPTNRFAEDIMEGEPRKEMSAAYPRLYSCLDISPIKPGETGEWLDNFTSLKECHRHCPAALQNVERTIWALNDVGYKPLLRRGHIVKDIEISLEAYAPGFDRTWLRICPHVIDTNTRDLCEVIDAYPTTKKVDLNQTKKPRYA